MGLLSAGNSILEKAKNLSQNKSLAFSDFISKNNIEICFILEPIADFYFCRNSFGLDGKSILQTYSTKAFWDGLKIKSEGIIYFSKLDNSITQFYQFFSFDLKDKINSLSVYKDINGFYFILVNNTLSDSLIQDYKLLDFNNSNSNYNFSKLIEENYTPYCFTCDFTKAFSTFSNIYNKNKKIDDKVYSALSNEIYNRSIQFLSLPNVSVKKNQTTVSGIIFSKGKLTETLLLNHFIKNFISILDNCSKFISISFEQKTNDVSALLNHIKVN